MRNFTYAHDPILGSTRNRQLNCMYLFLHAIPYKKFASFYRCAWKCIFTLYVQSLYFSDFFWFNEQSSSIYMYFLFLFAYLLLYTYLLHYLLRSYCGRDTVLLTRSSPWERPWLSWTALTWCISPQTGINSFLRGLLTSAPTNRLISGDVRLAL